MQVPARARHAVHFGPFAVDLVSHELRHDGRRINLQEKPFQVLVVLLEQPDQLVTREELRRRLWPADTFVDFEHSINTAIKKVREALEDSGEHPKFIETLPRRGYRFIGPIEVPEDQPPATEPAVEVSPARTQVPRPAAVWYASKAIWIAASLMCVLLIAATNFWHRSRQGGTPGVVMASIAVLPFADLSPGHDHEYFSEGLAEEILNRLTKIPN